MTRPAPTNDTGSNENLESTVRRAMQSLGWLIPESPEDVAQAEAELEDDPISLPPALRDSQGSFDRQVDEQPQYKQVPTNAELERNLARAAREGGQITPEVEERMRSDREEARRDGKRST